MRHKLNMVLEILDEQLTEKLQARLRAMEEKLERLMPQQPAEGLFRPVVKKVRVLAAASECRKLFKSPPQSSMVSKNHSNANSGGISAAIRALRGLSQGARHPRHFLQELGGLQ